MGRWEHFDHEADIGVRGIGASCAEAFEQAAMALVAVSTEPALITARECIEISCHADDAELLLVDWLNEVICEMATRNMLFGRFEVYLDQDGLRAKAWGDAADPDKYHPAVEVKGASYAGLSVREREDGTWIAECIVDV